MGRDLTKRYSLPSEKKGVKNPFLFFQDVYRYGKLTELSSFMVWEVFHKLRLFPKKNYLKLNDAAALMLENASLSSPGFGQEVDLFFDSRELSIVRTAHNWKLLFVNSNGEIFGCLYPNDRELYKSSDNGETISLIKKFPEQIKSIFISSQNTIFVCIKGAVYRSIDNGDSFERVLALGSSASFFRHNNAMTETPNHTLMIAEYGNVWETNRWKKLAFLYLSSDEGETWESTDFLIKKGTNKHIHLVKYSRLFNKIFMADGDNYKKLWVTDSSNPADLQNAENWKPINRFHIQMGGHTAVIESDEKLVFGTDYQGGTNFLVETADGKNFTKQIVPDPYRRSPINNMVQRKSINGNEIWASLPHSSGNTRCLLMYTKDGGRSWNKVIDYSKATHNVSLISSSKEIIDTIYVSILNKNNNDRVVYRIADR